jgi:DNA topoisomerase-2
MTLPILEQKTVADFVDLEYRDYSLYTLYSRAIPSAIDGFKPAQRKIVYTANKVAKDFKKTSALAGDVVSQANYHHGSTSLESGIVVMSRIDNNVPIMAGKGYFGNRVVPKPAAARYTKSAISPNFAKYFVDTEICPDNIDPESPEPNFFLPIIPWVLVNGVDGIAVGYATTIQPREPDLLRKLTMAHVMGKDISAVDLPPSYSGFKGTIEKDGDSWVSTGIVKHKTKNVYDILELPCGTKGKDRMAFVKILNEMRKIGAIESYKDRCSKEGFHFQLTLRSRIIPKATLVPMLRSEIRQKWQDVNKKFTQEQLDKEIEKLYPKRVKLLEQFKTAARKPEEVINSLINNLSLKMNLSDNLTTIDEHGKLKVFDTAHDIIRHFADFRLSKYAERFAYRIERDSNKLKIAKAKRGFIRAVIAQKIILQGKKRKDSIDMLIALKIPADIAEMLMTMPIHSFCSDELDKLDHACVELEKSINIWKTADLKQTYLEDLKNLKPKV